jgi:hypothetical protein
VYVSDKAVGELELNTKCPALRSNEINHYLSSVMKYTG